MSHECPFCRVAVNQMSRLQADAAGQQDANSSQVSPGLRPASDGSGPATPRRSRDGRGCRVCVLGRPRGPAGREGALAAHSSSACCPTLPPVLPNTGPGDEKPEVQGTGGQLTCPGSSQEAQASNSVASSRMLVSRGAHLCHLGCPRALPLDVGVQGPKPGRRSCH